MHEVERGEFIGRGSLQCFGRARGSTVGLGHGHLLPCWHRRGAEMAVERPSHGKNGLQIVALSRYVSLLDILEWRGYDLMPFWYIFI